MLRFGLLHLFWFIFFFKKSKASMHPPRTSDNTNKTCFRTQFGDNFMVILKHPKEYSMVLAADIDELLFAISLSTPISLYGCKANFSEDIVLAAAPVSSKACVFCV